MAAVLSRGLGLARPGWRANLDIVGTVIIARLKIVSRYRGYLVAEAFLPIVLAAFPLILGVAIGGGGIEQAGENFAVNTGETNFALFMLLGACVFTVVTLMLWIIGFWMRREQQTGTLEALYLSPANRFYVLAGVSTYAFLRSLMMFFIALTIGSLIFGVNPLDGDVLLAMLFIAAGFLPLWGIGFAFGALIMRIKEADSLIQMSQWVVAFLMGLYYPITFFPPFLQYIAAAFPATIMTDGVRGSILGASYLFGSEWWVPFALLMAFSIILPLLGYEVFLNTERRMKTKEGVGQY